MVGRVIKNQNGYFTILGEEGALSLCRSRGKLKRKSTVLVGDVVDFDTTKGSEAVITAVHPRKNELSRPPVSNIDQMVLVSAIRTPDFNRILMDAMTALTENADIAPIIVISKADLAKEEATDAVSYYEKAGYRAFAVSSETGEGMAELRASFTGPIIAFSGPSGVGKSTLLGALLPDHHFATGEVSRITGRGKTTTRHAELVQAPEGYFLMDTPGYTLLDITSIAPEDLAYLYRDFRPYLGGCYFNNCIHDKEPRCSVKQAVAEGHIQKERYDSYLALLKDLRENRVPEWK